MLSSSRFVALLAVIKSVTVLAAPAAQTSGTGIGLGSVKVNQPIPFPITVDGSSVSGSSLTIDANWRWVHNKGGYQNCYTNSDWDPSFCPDPATCAANCEVEGVDIQTYANTYGVSVSSNSATLKFVTGSNYGSRLYLMKDASSYYGFNLLNREFTFTVDASGLGCGLNGALYFVGMDPNTPGAAYGLGYGDAQCPKDIKYQNGLVNVKGEMGSCAPEMDIWEANKFANAFTPHPCSNDKVQSCDISDPSCGWLPGSRYSSVCDKDGADYNPFRSGDKTFFGPSSAYTVDSSKPITVVTQFVTSDGTDSGDLVAIKRFYKQNGKTIAGGVVTDDVTASRKVDFGETNAFKSKGGLKKMGQQVKNMVLVMSIWDDTSDAQMKWLDSVYGTPGPNAVNNGTVRGPCSLDSGVSSTVRATQPNAQVVYSDIAVGPIKTSA